jgi:hypothetical protein
MSIKSVLAVAVALLCLPHGPSAQSPDSAVATARCQDATYSYSASRQGTCSGHGGVSQWLATDAATAKCNDGPLSASTSRRGTCSKHGGVARWLTSANAAAADARVWVNTSSGVYHCPGSRYYGGTKQGQYMTETEARATGYRPAYNRSCS